MGTQHESGEVASRDNASANRESDLNGVRGGSSFSWRQFVKHGARGAARGIPVIGPRDGLMD